MYSCMFVCVYVCEHVRERECERERERARESVHVCAFFVCVCVCVCDLGVRPGVTEGQPPEGLQLFPGWTTGSVALGDVACPHRPRWNTVEHFASRCTAMHQRFSG